jgi:beta-galactosidase
MCAEFWIGWFDHWGNGGHMTTSAQDNAAELGKILEVGNVNIYMFVGGTNFGFMNGSNYYDVLTPDVTSYDYDAVLTENGAFTPKYEALKQVIAKYAPIPEVSFSTRIRSVSYGECSLKGKVGLFEGLDDLAEGIEDTFPKSMERMGQGYGYILYRTRLEKEKRLERIRLYEANDRASIFVDKKPVLALYDLELLREHSLEAVPCENGRLDILVENMGRVNFGPMMDRQRKGIDGAVVLNGHQHYRWTHYPLPLDNLEKLDFSKGFTEGGPAFYRFEFEAEEPGDTWLDFAGWGKGCAFINGFNLGRFWEAGPQKRLYIPGPLVRKGKNEILLFETEGKWKSTIVLADTPDPG